MNKIQSNLGSPWVSTLVPYMQVHTRACMYPYTYLNMHTHMHIHPPYPCKNENPIADRVFNKLLDKVESEALRQALEMCLERLVWLQI